MKYAIFIVLSACIVLFAFRSPALNWDMIGYVASAKSYGSKDLEKVHKETYDELKAFLTSREYQVLANIPGYRKIMHSSARLFSQVLPFYQIRVVYISLIILLGKLGLSPFFATYLISSLCTLGALCLSAWILFDHLKLPFSAAFLPLLLAPLGVYAVAQLSTPDGLAFLASFIGFYLFLTNRHRALLFYLPLLVLVRTDLVLLVCAFALFFLFIDRKLLMHYLACLAISLLLLFGINSYFHNYGWNTVFYMTLIHKVTNPADLHLAVTPRQYLQALFSGINRAAHDWRFVLFAVLSILIALYHAALFFFRRISSFGADHKAEILLYVNLLYCGAHFFLFPITWDRFFVSQYVFTVILAAYLLNRAGKYLFNAPLDAAENETASA